MRSAEQLRQSLARVLLLVRSELATSRRALAQEMQISPSTAGQYVDQLIESGWLRESGLEQGGTGRPKRALSVCGESGYFVGMEFHAARVQAMAIDFAGKVVDRWTEALPREVDREGVFRCMEQAVGQLSGPSQLLALGVGAPGVVIPEQGVSLGYSYIRDWVDVPVASRLQEGVGVPVRVDNNLRAIAAAERWFGGGQHLKDYAVLGPRSGFGVALVADGHRVHGSNHAAGEIGCWPWPLQGHSARQGQLQDYLSAQAIYRRLSGAEHAPADLREALLQVRSPETEAWQSVIRDFGLVLGLLHLMQDMGTYFLHGPLTVLGESFCEAVSRSAQEHCPSVSGHPPRVVLSALGDDAGALGAASLAMEAWQPDLAAD